jgi:hypothetical protein
MYGAILNYDSYVLLDGYHLTGVNNFAVSSRSSNSIKSPIGTENGTTFISGPTSQSFSLSRNLVFNDPFFDYIGKEKPIRGEIYDSKENSFYGFQSGYIKNYSVNCAVGAAPKVNTSFNILDEIKSGYLEKPNKKIHPEVQTSSQGSVLIESEDFQDNRVVGFDYSISVDQEVLYRIGSTNPAAIIEKRPIKYTASVQLELDKTYNGESFDFLRSRENRDISMNIASRRGVDLQNVTIPRASLISKNLSQNAQGVMLMNLLYVGHLGADREFYP